MPVARGIAARRAFYRGHGNGSGNGVKRALRAGQAARNDAIEAVEND